VTLAARTIPREPADQIIADGRRLALIGGFVGLVATDTITLQNQAQISVAGPNGGVLALQAGNDIVMGGSLQAQATASDGIGGDINVTSAQGNLTISGGGIRADGGKDVDNGASGGPGTPQAHRSRPSQAPNAHPARHRP